MGASRSRTDITHTIGHRAGRSFLGDTERSLQSGPEPDRIDRELERMNDGLIGHAVAGWPYDGNANPIPHIPIPRKPMSAVPFSREIDTGVTIPAVYVSQPVTSK